MKIYVLGNILVEQDSLPIKILPKLRQALPDIEFIELDPSEDFPKEKSMVIIDTVINAKEVCIIKDIDRIELGNACSLHDFDLGYNLRLMKRFRILEDVTIIGVPPHIKEGAAVAGIIERVKGL